MGLSASKSQVPGGRFVLGSSKAFWRMWPCICEGLENNRVDIGSDCRHHSGNTWFKNMVSAVMSPEFKVLSPAWRLPQGSIGNISSRFRQFTPHSVLLTNCFYFIFINFDQFWRCGKHNDQKNNANDEKQDAQDQFSDANDEKTRKIENRAPKNTTRKRR